MNFQAVFKHTAKSFEFSLEFHIHWIPSHSDIDQYSFGRFSIQGNQNADRLAEFARKQAYEALNRNQVVPDRDYSRQDSRRIRRLISERLVVSGNVSDGPSSDDISPTLSATWNAKHL